MEGFVIHSTKFVWMLKGKDWLYENVTAVKRRSGDLPRTPKKKELKIPKGKFYNACITLGDFLMIFESKFGFVFAKLKN